MDYEVGTCSGLDDFDWRKRELSYEAIGWPTFSSFSFSFPCLNVYVFGSLMTSFRITFLVASTFIPPSLSAATYC